MPLGDAELGPLLFFAPPKEFRLALELLPQRLPPR